MYPQQGTKILKAKQVDVVAPRPPEAPEGWLVFNAARPLHCSVNGENMAMWRGDWVRGYDYAAVNPKDPFALMWIELNLEDHAVLIKYVTVDEVKECVRRYCAECPEVSFEDLDWKDIHGTYFELNGEREIELEITFEGASL